MNILNKYREFINENLNHNKILFNNLSKMFPYSSFENNIMLFSNKLNNNSSINIWGIEDHIYSLKLKIVDSTINIIAISNQGGPLGYATKIVDIIHDFALANNYNINIVNDESGGYWNKIISKYNDNIITVKI